MSLLATPPFSVSAATGSAGLRGPPGLGSVMCVRVCVSVCVYVCVHVCVCVCVCVRASELSVCEQLLVGFVGTATLTWMFTLKIIRRGNDSGAAFGTLYIPISCVLGLP